MQPYRINQFRAITYHRKPCLVLVLKLSDNCHWCLREWPPLTQPFPRSYLPVRHSQHSISLLEFSDFILCLLHPLLVLLSPLFVQLLVKFQWIYYTCNCYSKNMVGFWAIQCTNVQMEVVDSCHIFHLVSTYQFIKICWRPL